MNIDSSARNEILFAKGFEELSAHIGANGRNTFWIVDANTSRMVRPLPEPNVILPPGESAKNWDSVTQILQAASRERLAENTRFIGFGGGTVCDAAGFAASLYNGGCQLTLIPTTLVAMADSCLGDEHRVNFSNTRSMVFSRHRADQILICIQALDSLPSNTYRTGLSQIIRNCAIAPDPTLYVFMIKNRAGINSRDPEILGRLIRLSLTIKQEVLNTSPVSLSLGNDFSDAFLQHDRMKNWSYGEALAWGLGRSIEAGMNLGLTNPQFGKNILSLLEFFGFDTSYRLSRGQWLDFRDQLAKQPRRSGQLVQFVLPCNQGTTVLQALDWDLLRGLVIRQAIEQEQ